MKFRKRPIVIDAVQWVDTDECREAMNEWFNARDALFETRGPLVQIDTLEGVMQANPGDWIICGVAGEIYPCKPDIFEKTYEVVSAPVCATCDDTHRMTLGEREVLCTWCPRPCEGCRLPNGAPYCAEAPCGCKCHE